MPPRLSGENDPQDFRQASHVDLFCSRFFARRQTPDRTALPQNRNCLQSLFHRSFLSPNKKPFDAPNATNNKANLPPRKLVNLFAKKWTTFAREFMAPGPPSKLSPLAFPRLAAPASIFLLLPARNHHPLARRKEDPRPNLPANGPIPRSASGVARVLLLPLPRRSLVFLKLAPASAVPKATIALPRKPRKPDRTTEQSDAVKSLRNHSCSSGGHDFSRAVCAVRRACSAASGWKSRPNLMEVKGSEAHGHHREGSKGSVEQRYGPMDKNWI
jgi:hypothetical protein